MLDEHQLRDESGRVVGYCGLDHIGQTLAPVMLRRRKAEVLTQLETFHADANCRLFLSTDAGGVGLNLQHAAAVVVNMDMPWNPAVLEQRIGRVHRMGQSRGVQVAPVRLCHPSRLSAIPSRVKPVCVCPCPIRPCCKSWPKPLSRGCVNVKEQILSCRT